MARMDRDSGMPTHAFPRLHRAGVVFATAVFACTLAVAIGTGSALAAPQVTVLGAAAPATPACPTSCQAVARTTGFQTRIGAGMNPFLVPYRGRIVAWSIKLGAPSTKVNPNTNESDVGYFNRIFGESQARLSVLKPIQKKIKQGKPIYKLKSQSPIERLQSFFGTTTTFTLQSPLRVKPGQVVAISVPTWAPALALSQGGSSVWAASRKKQRCATSGNQERDLADVLAGRSQETVGADRAYGCVYKTARILYSATVVKDPNQPAPPKKKKS
jgi:hypothetical protein